MTYLGIILVLLLGFSIIQFINEKYSLIEIVGFSFLLGIGATTLLMFFLDITGTIITAKKLIIMNLLISSALNYRIILSPKKIISQIKELKKNEFFFFGKFNLVWLLFLAGIIFILYGITTKSLYWPSLASDTLSSFDLYAKAIAHEGKLLNSLIYDKGVGYGAAYPPLYSLSLAYSYIFGFETSKIMPALFFISFIISFYALLIKNGTSLAAIITTFFMMISPELLAQSAINTTSVPQAVYGSLGIIAIFTWYQTTQNKYLVLSVILLALNGWIRSEGIVYIGAAFVFYFIVQFQKKEYLKPFLLLIISMVPFIIWQIFLKINVALMDQFVQVELKLSPNLDAENIRKILIGARVSFFTSNFYGITIYVFLSAIVLNFIALYKKKQSLLMLAIVLIPLIGYLVLLNQLHLRADSIEAIMRNSAKRFFFGMVILMWFYSFQIYHIRTFFTYLENFISLPPKQNKK